MLSVSLILLSKVGGVVPSDMFIRIELSWGCDLYGVVLFYFYWWKLIAHENQLEFDHSNQSDLFIRHQYPDGLPSLYPWERCFHMRERIF